MRPFKNRIGSIIALFCIVLISWLAVSAQSATPVFTGCPDQVWGTHCDSICFQVVAVDTSNSGNGNNVRYHLVSGPGEIDERTGLWVYHPELEPPTSKSSELVEIAASVSHDTTHEADNCQFRVFAGNNRPRFSRQACGRSIPLEVGEQGYHFLEANDPDSCDRIQYSIQTVSPAPSGSYSLNLCETHLTFEPAIADQGQTFAFTVVASDGMDSSICSVDFEVGPRDPFVVKIEQVKFVLQGHFVDVDVIVESQPFGLGGFNLLMSYDASALTFQGASEGDLFTECEWEYFTYRFGPDGNCKGGCPSGMLRVVGMANVNNGQNYPTCFEAATPYKLISLSFLVSNDRTLECQFVPIRFFWIDCGDNTLADNTGTTLFVSESVSDWDPVNKQFIELDPADSLCTANGAPEFCKNQYSSVVPFIDFYNGGIETACADSITGVGDMNLNGITYEATDLSLFAQYFTEGLSVFPFCPDPGSLDHCEALATYVTDINADGVGLTVEDFVGGIRVMQGLSPDDLNPNPTTDTAEVFNDWGSATVNWLWFVSSDSIGAVFFVIKGHPSGITTFQENVVLDSKFDGVNTKVLAYAMLLGRALPSDLHIQWFGQHILEIQLASFDGRKVPTEIQIATDIDDDDPANLPGSFALHQNYPNPFNPSTEISFDLPEGAYVKLELFDITGRRVATIYEGSLPAGSHRFKWDGIDDSGNRVASGVYLYRLQAGEWTDSKKMLLLK